MPGGRCLLAVFAAALLLVLSLCVLPVRAHGRLIEPPSRASMWRYGFKTPPDYNDHESYCGGFTRQWVRNKGKCGVCGDAWDLPQPRAHEAGGTYGLGVVVRRYKRGAAFTVRVEVTANHRGHFEFRLCKQNAPKAVSTQRCFNQHVLRRAKSNTAAGGGTHPTWFHLGDENGVYEMRYSLPKNLTCSQCVLQWRYRAANNWGQCDNASYAIGCGPQEEFRACADIAIEDKDGDVDETPYEEVDGSGEGEDINEVENITVPPEEEDWLFVSIIILLSSLFLSILFFVLLFIYYYGPNQNYKTVLAFKFTSQVGSERVKSKSSLQPVAPPRSKKPSSSETRQSTGSMA